MTDADFDAMAKRLAGQTEKLAGELRTQREAANEQLAEVPHTTLAEYLDSERVEPAKPTS